MLSGILIKFVSKHIKALFQARDVGLEIWVELINCEDMHKYILKLVLFINCFSIISYRELNFFHSGLKLKQEVWNVWEDTGFKDLESSSFFFGTWLNLVNYYRRNINLRNSWDTLWGVLSLVTLKLCFHTWSTLKKSYLSLVFHFIHENIKL